MESEERNTLRRVADVVRLTTLLLGVLTMFIDVSVWLIRADLLLAIGPDPVTDPDFTKFLLVLVDMSSDGGGDVADGGRDAGMDIYDEDFIMEREGDDRSGEVDMPAVLLTGEEERGTVLETGDVYMGIGGVDSVCVEGACRGAEKADVAEESGVTPEGNGEGGVIGEWEEEEIGIGAERDNESVLV